MSWNLQIIPNGLLLSKYLKNNIIVNPNNVGYIEKSQLLTDGFQTFNGVNNTVNLNFSLDLYNSDPQNDQPEPFIQHIDYIILSNDPEFKEIYLITPAPFSSDYNKTTNYILDLSNLDINSEILPASAVSSFNEISGTGLISVQHWPLSGSSGLKRVFFKTLVTLSDGSSASYPGDAGVFDEIYVVSDFQSAPSLPKIIGITSGNYTSSPVYFQSKITGNSSVSSYNDLGVAAYFWDALVLASPSDIVTNNKSEGTSQLFNTALSTSIDLEKFPIILTSDASTGIASTAPYNIYFSNLPYSLSTSNNIYFYEMFVNNYMDTLNWSDSPSIYFEFNLVDQKNKTSNTKHVRNQLIINLSKTTLTTYTSIDDSSWSSNPTVVPNSPYIVDTIVDPNIVGLIASSGLFTFLVELIDETAKVFKIKLMFKPAQADNHYIIIDEIFSSNTLILNTDVFVEFKSFIANSISNIALESNQYGICRGSLSASTIPNDKIGIDKELLISSSIDNLYNSEDIKTWFVISNAPSSGVVNSSSGVLALFNNTANNSQNNLSSVEIQNAVPTFSEDASMTASFEIINVLGNQNDQIKVGYSYDSHLNYSDFTITDLLKTSAGVYIPNASQLYNIFSSLDWAGSDVFELNMYDVGLAQTCSITTSVTDNLFFYSSPNESASLHPPAIIKTKSGISSSNTFNAWFSTGGFSTSLILSQKVIVENLGNSNITISTSLTGLNTVLPGQPYVINSISTNASTPTVISVNSHGIAVTNSVNFLYDFGSVGTIEEIGISVQITTPPDCPATLPSFQYSIEVSNDFINWIYLQSSTSTQTFDPNTGNITFVFSTPNNIGDQEEYRYARLRFYYNASATFDPRESWRYSRLNGNQSVISSSIDMTGKFVVGFTDTMALNNSLGQLYNQPTYLRQYISNSSRVTGVVFDFSDYQYSVSGPVYLNILTESSEKRFYTISNNFQSNTIYNISLSIERETADNAYNLVPTIHLSGGSLDTIDIRLDDILLEPNDIQTIAWGYYPFISLVGNGKVNVNASVIKGTYNHALSYQTDEAYFSLFSAEDLDYTSNYGQNILSQNTFKPTKFNFPQINTYFLANTVKNYSYSNVDFTVLAATTSSVSLYGTTYIDGVFVNVCDLVLVAGQSDKSQNGIYQVQTQQWVKQKISSTEPTILVTQGLIFNDTLWMFDIMSSEWIPNIIVCPLVLEDNSLLFTGISSSYKYPQYIKLATGVSSHQDINSLDQVKIKLVNSPHGKLYPTDLSTQWNSLLQNGKLNSLTIKEATNNTIFMNFAISSSQIASVSTSCFPAIYNIVASFSGNYSPYVTDNSDFKIGEYGSDYRSFYNNGLIYQMFSCFEKASIGQTSNAIINTGVHGYSVANQKSLQSGFSTDIRLDNVPPTVGILSRISDNIKSVALSLSTAYDDSSGLSIARIVQKNPSNEIIYGSWFGFTTSSYTGVASFFAYPSYITDNNGISTGEPLSGYYRYFLEVADAVGNISQTNKIDSFYYESALVDTQGPQASVLFVDNTYINPISISSSTVITAQLFAQDALSGVKAYRYRILPDGEFGNWIDFSEYANIVLPEAILDGTLSVQFQFKDFGNNVLYSDSTVINENFYVYTWNIVSKLITDVLFTVVESATFDDNEVILIGASKNGHAALFLWDSSKLFELQYAGFGLAKSITAIISVGSNIVIGTDIGQIFLYQNGIVSGAYEIFNSGGTGLPISKFTIHKYPNELESYLYATTLNTPRIFRTPISELKNLSWENVQTPPISVLGVNVLNGGLWSGNSIYYSISSSYQSAVLVPNLLYGISSVIISNKGSNYTTQPSISIGGAITGASLNPIMQGRVEYLNLFAGGLGYTAGASVSISSPASGSDSIQATGYAVTNSLGQIISIGLSSAGYGYTQTPVVSISGVLGLGSQASASAAIVYDSIYAVDVVSAGYATTTAISINVSGLGTNASLNPSLLYRVQSVSIANPGFGFTSEPTILINGISTLATAEINNGSIDSVTVVGYAYTFPVSQSASAVAINGYSTNWVGVFNTSSISFSTGSGVGYTGTIISSITLQSGGLSISTTPSISFASSIYEPEISFILSDDLTLASGNGSIYDIKSFDNKLFFTSSLSGIVELGYSSGVFNSTAHALNLNSKTFSTLSPTLLEVNSNGVSSSLFFTTKEEPFIGVLQKSSTNKIFEAYQDNILLFRPYNFDILSDWQLIKILNVNGIGTADYGDSLNSTLLIENYNSQIYYQSTKNNIWFNRCSISSSYLFSSVFIANSGTQSIEIATFNSVLQASFTATENGLTISFGNQYYSSISIDSSDVYKISFVKNVNDIYIYNENELIFTQNNFFENIPRKPVIKFGYIFEPLVFDINSSTQNIFGLPNADYSSSFVWKQIKFAYNQTSTDFNSNYYTLSLPYVIQNAESVRVLKNINNTLYAVTKALTDQRTTTTFNDSGSKVYRFGVGTWSDVTGNFEVYNAGINTSYIISSPNDIGALNNSFFITGIVKASPSRKTSQSSIVLGLSTSITYEEADLLLTIIYPYNPEPSGTFVQLSNNNGVLSVPESIYFSPNDIVKAINVGVAATGITTTSSITATDGITTASTSCVVIPLGISSVGLNTTLFVGFSSNSVIANITLQSRTATDRIVNVASSNSAVLNVPSGGIATILAGSISTSIVLLVGNAVTSNTSINITASYRSTISTATITATPFILSLGLSTNIFTGNQLYGSIVATPSIQTPPKANLTINLSSSLSTILSTPATAIISIGSATSTFNLNIGSAVTYAMSPQITASISAGVATQATTANPFSISTISASNYRPILGLQTSIITLTLSTAPASSLIVYNVVQNPSGVSMVYPSSTSFAVGSISTSYGIATYIQTSSGLGVTIAGAPLGYNTSPTPGLTLLSDIWRITDFTITPTSIVGGGANSLGVAQSFILTATLNLGVGTTVYISSNTTQINVSNLNFTGSLSTVGYATGFSTSAITNLSITATGPSGMSSTLSNLTLNPFLISDFSLIPSWGGGYSSNYTVGGIGATTLGVVTLNAYVATGVHTVKFSGINTYIFAYDQSYVYPNIGYATVTVGSNTTSIALGFNTVYSSFSTSVTATSFNAIGIATSSVLVKPIPEYDMVFEPILANQPANIFANLSYPIPVAIGISVTISNGQSVLINVQPSLTGVSSVFQYGSISFNTTLIAQTTMVGLIQTYYVTGYAKSGGAFGMGYNMYGELSRNYPVSGSTGSYKKIFMGLPKAVKTASGNHHNIMMDYNGDVYGIGDNTYNQLAYLNIVGLTTSIFKIIDFPYKAKAVYAQNNSSYVLLSDNSLYSFGANNSYCLGTSSFTGVATYVPQLISTSVHLFSAYNDRGALITYNNKTGIQSLYEFGQYQSVAGLVGKAVTQVTYNGVTKNVTGIAFSNINVGPTHTVASAIWVDLTTGVSSSGVLAWGGNSYGQIGIASTSSTVSTPNVLHKYNSLGTAVPIENSNLIFADYNFSMIIGAGNSIYTIGAAITSNSAGTATGTASTVISQYPPLGFATNTALTNVYKNSKHYIWNSGIGSVYVSGGVLDQSIISTINTANIQLFAENNYVEQAESANCIDQSGSRLVLFNAGVVFSHALPDKYVAQPVQYFGPNTSSYSGGFIALFNSTNLLAYYYDLVSGWQGSWVYGAADDCDGLADISIGVSNGVSTSLNPKLQWVFIHGIKNAYNGVTTTVSVNSLLGVTTTASSPLSLNAQTQTSFTRTSYATKIDNTHLKNYIGFAYTYSAVTYQWQTTSRNYALGYQNGLMEIYGDGWRFGVGSTIVGSTIDPAFIGSWTVDSEVSCLKSIMETSGSNNVYLITATTGRYVYSYDGDGGGDANVNYSQSTALPRLIASTQLDLTYGYITLINSYVSGSFIAATSNNYLIIVSNSDLRLISSILVPSRITSLLWSQNSTSTENHPNSIFVTTSSGSVYSYYVDPEANYEIGLNYVNAAGNYQVLTYNGIQSGLAVTSCFESSTSDTFSIILDSSRPNG